MASKNNKEKLNKLLFFLKENLKKINNKGNRIDELNEIYQGIYDKIKVELEHKIKELEHKINPEKKIQSGNIQYIYFKYVMLYLTNRITNNVKYDTVKTIFETLEIQPKTRKKETKNKEKNDEETKNKKKEIDRIKRWELKTKATKPQDSNPQDSDSKATKPPDSSSDDDASSSDDDASTSDDDASDSDSNSVESEKKDTNRNVDEVKIIVEKNENINTEFRKKKALEAIRKIIKKEQKKNRLKHVTILNSTLASLKTEKQSKNKRRTPEKNLSMPKSKKKGKGDKYRQQPSHKVIFNPIVKEWSNIRLRF